MSSARILGPTIAGLLALAAAAGAAPGGEAHRRADCGDSYILSRGDHWSISSGSLEALRATRRRFSGDFLWAMRGGREVLIRDPNTLAEATAAFSPMRELEPEQRALEGKQRDLESRQSDLDSEQEDVDRELDRLSDDESDEVAAPGSEETRRDLERRLRDLESRARALEGEDRELEAQERAIDERTDALEKQAEAKLWALVDRAVADGRAEVLRKP